MADVFLAALEEMVRAGEHTFGPRHFKDYCRELGVKADTWSAISVDHINRLSPSLQEAQCMVLRLGSQKGRAGTRFALVRARHSVEEFFIAPPDGKATLLLPDCPYRELLPFRVLPSLSETALVSFAAAAGVLSTALRLDTSVSSPATTQFTSTFDVRPRADLDVTWEHYQGQIEIDAVMAARRGGEETLFVVEAKAGSGAVEVAKHKLVYPVCAIAAHVPLGVRIVPVYLHVVGQADGFRFDVVECEYPPLGRCVRGNRHVRRCRVVLIPRAQRSSP